MRLSAVGLIVTLALGIFMAPLAVEAQQAGKVYRIGWLAEGVRPDEPAILVLQRGFTLVGSSVRGDACDVRDTPHGFSAGDRPGCQAPTACQTRGGARRSPTPARLGAASLLGLFFNRRLMRTTKKCARMTKVI